MLRHILKKKRVPGDNRVASMQFTCNLETVLKFFDTSLEETLTAVVPF